MPLPGNRELLFQSVLWVLLLCSLMIGAGGVLLGDATSVVRPPHLMLRPGSALVILISGVGLLALIYRRAVIRFICVGALILLLGYGLVQLMQRTSSGPAVWLPPMSLLMVLVGGVSLALGIEGRVRRVVWCLTALFFIAVGLASLLFYLRPASGLLPHSLVASSLMGGIFCLLFGLSMLIVVGVRPWRFGLLSREAMVAGAIGVLASGVAWYLVSWQQYQYQRKTAHQDVVHVAEMTEQELETHSRLMLRLTSRWHQVGSGGGHNIRDLELRSYLRDFPSLQALAVTGHQGQWRRARTAEALLWLEERLDDDDVQQWLARLPPGQGEWYFPAQSSSSSLLHGVRLGGASDVLSVAALDLAGLIERGSHNHLEADVVNVVQGERRVITLDQRALALEDTSLPIQRISKVTLPVGEGQPLTFSAYADWPGLVTLAGLLPVLVGALGLTLTYQLVASLSLMASRTAWGKQLQAASRELRISEQRFRSLFTQNPDGVFTHSQEGVYESLNPAAAATLGIAEAELLGRHYHSIVQAPVCSPEDVERTDAAFRRAAAGAPGSYTMRFSKDGEHFQHLEVTMMPIIVDGEVDGVFGIAKDITARVAAEERLRVLQRSLDASLNGVIISEAGQHERPIIYVNQAFTAITGYHAEEVIGRDCRLLQGPDSERERIEEIRQGLATGQDVRVTLRNYRKDGSMFWNQLYVSPVEDLDGRVSHFISIVHDISERKAQEKELAYHATHDPLTDLANRSLLEDRLAHDVALGARHNRLLGVLFVDLDEFKPINDTLGHAIGDEVLRQVARRLEQGVRPSDTVARFGGDEFVVVLPDLVYDGEALLIADRLVESLSRPYRIQRHELHLSASIGIALGKGDEHSAQLLIQQADMAMYKAKRRGRRTVELFTQDINEKLIHRLQLRHDLETALDAQQFELHYQPLIRREGGGVAGCEALVRWQHPEKGFISPAEFIPLAEETGLIVPLGRWILERACRDFRLLRELGLSDCRVAVNLSPLQFNRPDFFKGLCQMLEATGLPPQGLELEMTEGVLLDGSDSAIETLHALRGLSVSVAIDDFGTGFSSLSYLRHMPINKLKIDRSFVNHIVDNDKDAAIVEGIITLAHRLEMEVVAEGIETAEQLEHLDGLDCDIYQGYLFAKPMPLAALDAWLVKEERIRPVS